MKPIRNLGGLAWCLLGLLLAAAGGARAEDAVLNAVDVGRLPDNRTQLRFHLSQGVTPAWFSVNQPPRIVLDFPGTRSGLAARRQDVNTGGVERISVVEADGRTRALVNLARMLPYTVTAEGDSVLLTLDATAEPPKAAARAPAAAAPSAAAAAPRVYQGELLSLNFQDIEVRAVLQIIADFTGLNIVVSDSVTGRITLRLKNVPWDQALEIITQTKGLTQRRSGNVIYVAPTAEIAQREKLELEARKQSTELVPLRSELIQVNYAKAADLARLLKSRGGEAGGAATGQVSLLSERGQVSVDDRTNTLLINDLPERLGDIRALVTKLDVPVRQVMIDSRVVIANDDFSKELGVRFGGLAVIGGPNTNTGIAGTIEGADAGNTSGRGPGDLNSVPLNQRLGVNLPVTDPTGPAGVLGIAILGSNYLIDLELSALQAEGRGEILSNPRVLTADRKEASIKQGREIPYTAVSNVGGATTQNISFKDALLELTVTPQITPDKNIIMDLKITKNEDSGQRVQGQPVLDKREINTQVLVRNGETVVLGGVFEQLTRDNVDKVPLLGDLPVIGRLFSRTINSNKKLELLIFVTPQIVDDKVVVR